MVYDGVLKGVKDETVNQMVDDVTRVLKDVTDESWVPWVACLIREAEKACEEAECKVQDEAECQRHEKLTKAMWWEKRVNQKLTDVLEGRLPRCSSRPIWRWRRMWRQRGVR